MTALFLLAPVDAGAASGSISGTVVDAGTEEGIGDVEVCAYSVEAEEESETEEAAAFECAESRADGRYEIDGLPPGEYMVEFSPAGESHAREFFDGRPARVEADHVVVASGEPTTGIGAELPAAALIRGTVTAAWSGAPVEGAEACAYLASYGIEGISCGVTGADGSYAIGRLPEGEYKVEFRVDDLGANLAPQMYDHRYSWKEGEPVPVAAGAEVQGLDAQLDPGAEITGTVSGAAAGPVGGTRVCGFWTEEDFKWDCTHTDPSGRYRLWQLPPKVYRVGFSLEYGIRLGPQIQEDDGYLDQYSGGASTLSSAEIFPLEVGGAAHDVDASLLRSEEAPAPAPLPLEAEPPQPEDDR